MASSSIWWHRNCIAWQRVLTNERNRPVFVEWWWSWRPQLTVTPSSYYSKLIAGSICVTLTDLWIVWVGQDSCYSSLYVIECSLIDHIPEVGHLAVPLIWLLGQPHLRWEWWAIIPSCPLATIVFYHVMGVACHHSFWAVTLRLYLCLVALQSFTHKYSRPSVEVHSMPNLSVDF
jgi:hypothetical protein